MDLRCALCSRFGGADDFWPYLTGDWSFDPFGLQPMPFDGFLLASCVMVAKEAQSSSPRVKDLIAAAKGVDDARWEGTYAEETGGILTVRSELGGPIHKEEFDNTVSNLFKEKRTTWPAERKSKAITKLNEDFSKPWFGWKKDGHIVEDIADMTYKEVILRMIPLMHVGHKECWIDVSPKNFTSDRLRHIKEHFAGIKGDGSMPSILQFYTSLDKPTTMVQDFFKKYIATTEQFLASEDTAYFLAISQRPGQKPAPFIPILEVWFKKASSDSLWAAEDPEAVFDQDSRVCVLQGSVTVKHAVVVDDPSKDLLSDVVTQLAQKLLERSHGGDISKVSTIDHLGIRPLPLPETITAELGVEREITKKAITYTLGKTGSTYIDNPMRRLFAPRLNQRAVVETTSDGIPTALLLDWSARSFGEQKSDFKAVEARFNAAKSQIDLALYEDREDASVPLYPHFEHKPSHGSDSRGRGRGVQDDEVQASMDFVIVTGWEAMFPSTIDGDFLKLVHLSNGFKLLPGVPPLKAGDLCRTEGRIRLVVIINAGQVVKVKCTIFCNGKPIVEVVSALLYCGRFSDFENTFEIIEEPDYVVLKHPWAFCKARKEGSLIFRVKSDVTYRNKTCFKVVTVTGDVFIKVSIKQLVKVGSVDFHQDDSRGNPVADCLKRHGAIQGLETSLPNGGYTVASVPDFTVFNSPNTNEPYSKVSGNFNPIHSAATRKYLETVVAQGNPNRIASLLFATQFAQVALVATEKPTFEDMHDKGFVQTGSTFAGHSLREYSALASVADVLWS
ncbi:hypothetical protein BXZ70DRAFT_1030813 [Cristinia sonorae]|uniref:Uncharacterized protein n=1 Tax=Cristinia sonorae TaxID=1940300 RepID=A0A8K0ULF5_9AGAR|nr:hypothetical protein BXZ70DRAFT_1030813 [Cristinia sonorae]